MIDGTFTFLSGPTVELVRLNVRNLRDILDPVGGISAWMALDDEMIRSLTPEQVRLWEQVNVRMQKYCFGWGVKDAPPETDTQALEDMGYSRDNMHLLRAAWVQFILLADGEAGENEAGELIGSIMSNTLLPRMVANG